MVNKSNECFDNIFCASSVRSYLLTQIPMTQAINPCFQIIRISKEKGSPAAYYQLSKKIENLISEGFLKSGDELPSSRVLSSILNLSRTTVTQAYKRLLEEGWIFSQKGRGCFVSECSIDLDLHKSSFATLSGNIKKPKLPVKAEIAKQALQFPVQKEVPFALIAPDMESLPGKDWTTIVARVSKSPWMHNAYAEPGGYRPFKKVIADLLRRSRGINCSDSQVIITSGVQEDLYLALQALFSEGAKIAVEDPGFRPHRDLVEFLGHRPIPIPVNENGISINQLSSDKELDAVIVTPSFQYPTGYLMSLERKLELIDWANSCGKWILEDGYDTELFTADDPNPAIASLDQTGSTIYMGSFTKTIYPGFNMGYIVVPEQLIPIVEGIKMLTLRHSSEVHSVILTEFIEGGFYEAHIRRLKRMYQKRRETSVQCIQSLLTQFGALEANTGGTHLTFIFKPELKINDVELNLYLRQNYHLESRPLSPCYVKDKPQSGLILGYAHFSEQILTDSYRRLRDGITNFLKRA